MSVAYRFPPRSINTELLAEQLSAAFGAEYIGLTSGSQVVVYVQDGAAITQEAIDVILTAHNPAERTAAQQQQEQRQQEVAALIGAGADQRIEQINTALGIVDTATTTQVRTILRGLLEINRDMLRALKWLADQQ